MRQTKHFTRGSDKKLKVVCLCNHAISNYIINVLNNYVKCAEVERVQKYSTQVKVPLHY